MSRTMMALGLLAALAACGIDGPPQAPATTVTVKPGVTVSGDAQIGMRGTL